jgi:2,4-dienoyl-CoA reductase-like NADH-dependent reductase (Old Yellow Enzyme family)/thioredoxin reductase
MPLKLLTPIKIGNVQIDNRIVMPAMGSFHSSPGSKITEGVIRWYEARAKGRVGLIIVEFTAVTKKGLAGPNTPGIWDDSFIPGFQELTRTIHRYNTKIFLQLCHAGRQTCKEFTGGLNSVSASPIPCPFYEPLYHEIPVELNISEIEEIIEQFGEAAARAKKSGFDGVEIHGAHGYLISQFLSPYSNKRHDAYGGDLSSRLKFPLEVIACIRRKVGRDFPLIFRLSGQDYVPDGNTIEETRRIAPVLEAAGVDCLHVSGGVYESQRSIIPPHGTPQGFHSADAARIKQVVKVPVITVGRIISPEVAENILQEGKADMVALGRQLICDPDWPVKVAAGNLSDIRYCIGCTQGCMKSVGQPVSCLYNTSAGIEGQEEIKTAVTSKTVLVIGGGPGGLEAARVAALRGHKVTLFEKSEKLGGRFNLACIAPFKQEYTLVIKYLSEQARKLGVKIELGREATPEVVAAVRPDTVIIATGAVPRLPKLKGINGKNVVLAEDILGGKSGIGNRVAVLGGGGVGCDVADFISQRGKQITLIEKLPEIGVPTGIPIGLVKTILGRLRKNGVRMIVGAEAKAITNDGVSISFNDQEETIPGIDQIIIAMGAKSDNDLAKQLEGKVSELYIVGDAREPRTAYEAIHEGFEIARKL